MKLLLPLLTLLLTSTCQKPAASTAATACIDPARIRADMMCTMQYDPVCGCNGKTYGNACAADNAGLTSYTKGPCPDTK